MGDARKVALAALERCRRGGAWSDAVLDGLIKQENLDRRDAALATRLCYGVLQNMFLCDFCVDSYSKQKSSRLEPKLLDILRLSVYQILFMDKIPDVAAVNEGVGLTKKAGLSRASGMVNAVLRRISENKAGLISVPGKEGLERLSICYSHPLWLVEAFAERFGYEQAEELLKANNSEVPITAQVNILKTNTSELAEKMNADMHPWLSDALSFDSMAPILDSGALEDGLLYIQDAAAKFAVTAASPAEGMRILDACAAPGGKSFAAAMLTGNKAEIISCDIHEKKLGRVQAGAERLGITCIKTRVMDARKREESFIDSFDIVIADVPCSGLGVIRKKPDIRYKSPEEIAGLPEIQLDILKSLSAYVRPGGTLIYSTCTVLKSENEDVISNFLAENEDFYAEEFDLPFSDNKADNGMVTLLPHIHKTDGFFICRIRRRK